MTFALSWHEGPIFVTERPVVARNGTGRLDELVIGVSGPETRLVSPVLCQVAQHYLFSVGLCVVGSLLCDIIICY